MSRTIFVFGSNLAGRHGKGAALVARLVWKARYGVGEGLTGNAYAIPTKGRNLEVLGLIEIHGYIQNFKKFAEAHPELNFLVTRVGCGLAGYKDSQIAPFFAGCPANCVLPEQWV